MMDWIWIVFVPITVISVFALIGHAGFMRAMMPPPQPDISAYDRFSARNRMMDPGPRQPYVFDTYNPHVSPKAPKPQPNPKQS